MHPLQGQSLTTLQEDFKHVRYILIDEMSFLGPKLLLKIDNRLRQAFPQKQHEPFGGISIILVGDLGQLPPVMDKPIYASHSTALMLWNTFNVPITLDTFFHQQEHTKPQIKFHKMLQNIQNVVPIKQDWKTLMT